MGHYDSCYDSEYEEKQKIIDELRADSLKLLQELEIKMYSLNLRGLEHSEYILTQLKIIGKLLK